MLSRKLFVAIFVFLASLQASAESIVIGGDAWSYLSSGGEVNTYSIEDSTASLKWSIPPGLLWEKYYKILHIAPDGSRANLTTIRTHRTFSGLAAGRHAFYLDCACVGDEDSEETEWYYARLYVNVD